MILGNPKFFNSVLSNIYYIFGDNIGVKIIDCIKQNILAWWISFFYVGLGGVVACSMYPDEPLNGKWWDWGWVITLPVNFISFAFRYTGDITYVGVVIIQCIVLIPTFLLFARIIPKRKKQP